MDKVEEKLYDRYLDLRDEYSRRPTQSRAEAIHAVAQKLFSLDWAYENILDEWTDELEAWN